MPWSVVGKQFGSRPVIPLSHAIVLLVGAVTGFLAAEYGDVLVRHPVESVLVAGLLAGVLTLAWAGRQLLHSAARRAEDIFDEELGPRPPDSGTGSGARKRPVGHLFAEWAEFGPRAR